MRFSHGPPVSDNLVEPAMHDRLLAVVSVYAKRADRSGLVNVAARYNPKPFLDRPKGPSPSAGRASSEELLAVPLPLHEERAAPPSLRTATLVEAPGRHPSINRLCISGDNVMAATLEALSDKPCLSSGVPSVNGAFPPFLDIDGQRGYPRRSQGAFVFCFDLPPGGLFLSVLVCRMTRVDRIAVGVYGSLICAVIPAPKRRRCPRLGTMPYVGSAWPGRCYTSRISGEHRGALPSCAPISGSL